MLFKNILLFHLSDNDLNILGFNQRNDLDEFKSGG
jgi:hypothetical protein